MNDRALEPSALDLLKPFCSDDMLVMLTKRRWVFRDVKHESDSFGKALMENARCGLQASGRSRSCEREMHVNAFND